jgi:hypothetical protein
MEVTLSTMGEDEIREALNRHWAASDANDFDRTFSLLETQCVGDVIHELRRKPPVASRNPFASIESAEVTAFYTPGNPNINHD